MESTLTPRISKPKNILKHIKYTRNSSQNLIKKYITSIKTNYNTSNGESNTSWDFTPFPDLYFPFQKKQAIRKINNLDFKNTFMTPKNLETKNIFHVNKYKKSISSKLFNNIIASPKILKSNSISYLFKENKGDITKYSPPAYSFGISREDCKFPFFQSSEQISPNPCSYNLRPLEGLGGSSYKYSIKKDFLLKRFRKHVDPGPGYYNIDKCDIKNNGNIMLSDIKNSIISNFGKYEERKDKIGFINEWNMKPSPGSYNINNTLSMFSGNGKYPLSKFKSNISKSIDKYRGLSKGRIKFIYPGPGDYNHYSIFKNFY